MAGSDASSEVNGLVKSNQRNDSAERGKCYAPKSTEVLIGLMGEYARNTAAKYIKSPYFRYSPSDNKQGILTISHIFCCPKLPFFR